MKDLDQLDYQVALADGWEPTAAPKHWQCNSTRPLKRGSDYMCWDCQGRRFSRDWADGGEIIERERISVSPSLVDGDWWARAPTEPGTLPKDSRGPTPLIAAMRAFVAKQGA
jgi:hypothetical protein